MMFHSFRWKGIPDFTLSFFDRIRFFAYQVFRKMLSNKYFVTFFAFCLISIEVTLTCILLFSQITDFVEGEVGGGG